MKKIAVIYWSSTGNTEQMANAVVEGANAKGADAKVFAVDSFNPGDLNEYDAVAFGCPAMGDEVLESDEFEPVFDECKPMLRDKPVGLFGSYGWGDGEWMRNWQQDCIDCGANVVADGVICCDSPDETALDECKTLGSKLAEI